MKKNVEHHIGIDIASETFSASVFQSPGQPKITQESTSNSLEGFQTFIQWLKDQGIGCDNSIVCMEATGVYGEALTHYLTAQGFSVAVEPPLKVKRAFDQDGHKTDSIDSLQIAEYAYRFFDELRFWRPLPETIEKLKHLLVAREQMVKQSVAVQNALKAYQRHILKEQMLVDLHQKHLAQIKEHITKLDEQIRQLILKNPSLHQLSLFLISLCGVGLLLAAHMLVITNGFESIKDYKQFAAFLGICPYKHSSGTSVYRKDRSRCFGPAYARKLLHLAARSVATHRPEFRQYYLRKIEEGKNKTLVLNNIANKLLKISFALIRNRQCFIQNYRSISPLILQNA